MSEVSEVSDATSGVDHTNNSNQVSNTIPKNPSKDFLNENPYGQHAASLSELREKYPEVYNFTMKSLLTNMLRQIGRHAKRMRSIRRTYG